MIKTSFGEHVTEMVLRKLKVKYKREVVLEELVDLNQKPLPIDFLILVEDRVAMIEFNGRQHYYGVNTWDGSLDEMSATFNRLQRNDQKRRDYVQRSGIPLLAIHFQDFESAEVVIKQFINHVVGRISKSEVAYAQSSRGYFTLAKKQNSELYRNAWRLFIVEKPSIYFSMQNIDLSDGNKNEFGQIHLGDGKILWTERHFNKLISKNKSLENEFQNVFDEMTVVKAKRKLRNKEIQAEKEVYALQISELQNRIEELEAENERLRKLFLLLED